MGGRGSWENDPQLKASRGCWASGRPDFVNTLEGLGVSGRLPGEGNGYPVQYSCLENVMDRGAWQATTHGVTKSQTQLSH